MWQGTKYVEPPPREQHTISKGRGWRGSGTRSQDLTDVGEQERFTASHKNFADTELGRFIGNPLYTCEAKLPPGRFGRLTDAAIVTVQVTVEIRVEPKARTDRPIGVGIGRRLPAADHPARAALLDIRIDHSVVRETAPSLQVPAKASFVANDGHKVSGITSAKCSDKLGQQAGSKRFIAGVELDGSFDSHTLSSDLRDFL